MASNVLAIRLRQMGDVIVTLGSLRAVKEAYPDAHIAFVVDSHYHALLRRVTYIDELVAEPPGAGRASGLLAFVRYVERLRSTRFDCVLDFHSNPRSALLSFLTGSPRRAGFDVKLRKMLYTDVEPRLVFVDGQPRPRTAHGSAVALCERGGFVGLNGSVERTIPVSDVERQAGREALAEAGVDPQSGAVGLNPGTAYPAKAWPDESFVALARRTVAAGRQVVINWGPGERGAANRIAAAAGDGVFVAPPQRIDELPGLLSHLSVVVGIDSGLKHLCVATGVPTVTLFGPTSPAEWHMGGRRDRILSAGLSCAPCRLTVCPFGEPCMRRIGVEDAFDAINAIEGSA